MRSKILSKILGIGVILLGLTFFNAGAAQANLFVDGGFDNGVNEWSESGHPWEGSSTFHTGPYGAENTITTVDTQEYYGLIYQIIPYAAGEPVYMEGYIKTDFHVGSTARAGVLVEFLDSADQIIPGTTIQSDLGAVNNWTKLYVVGTAPAGTAKARAGAFIYAAQYDYTAIDGKAYADDVSIAKITVPGGLIVNPGFEDGTSGWTPGGFDTTTDVKHSGTRGAFDMVESVTGHDYWGFVYQNPSSTIPAGSPIYASAFGKTNISELSTAKGGLIIQFFNGPSQIGELKSEIGGRTDWRQLYVSGTVPATTTIIKVGAYLWAAQNDTNAVNGFFYIDDFVLDTNPITPPPPPAELINPDFENGVNDWTFLYRPFFATNSVVHSGLFAAQHTIGDTNGAGDYLALTYQDIPYTAGTPAFLTAWLKTDLNPIATDVGGVKMGFYNASGGPITERLAETNQSRDWTLVYAYLAAPTNTVKIRVSCYAWAPMNQGVLNSNVYVDGITLSSTPPSELILNGGFENFLSGWTIDATGYPMIPVTEDHHTGAYSAKATIQQPPGTANYWSRIYQEFAFTPGSPLYATEWAKTNIPPGSGATAGIKMEFLSGSDVVLGSQQQTIGGQTGWTYLYVTAATAPTGTEKARISCFATATHTDAALGGTAYFDDVVASINPLPPPTYPIALTNVGFETGLNDWTDLYGFPSVIVADPHSGTYSAKKTLGVFTDQDYFSIIYQDIYYNASGSPFPTARNVYLSAYLKSNINVAASANVGIRLEYFDAQEVAHEISHDQISAANNWRQLYAAGTIPAGAVRVRVSGYAFALKGDLASDGGTVNFDDFAYSYSPITPPARPTTMLNTGFENGLNEWKDLYGPPTQLVTDHHGGTYGAQKTIVAIPNQDYFSTIYQDVYYNASGAAFPAAQPVYVTAYLKTNINPQAQANGGITVEYADALGVLHNIGEDKVTAVNNWRQLYIATTIPAGATFVRVSGYGFAVYGDAYALGGTIKLDDFVYSYTQIPPPALPTQLLNPGFENGFSDWHNLYRPAILTTEYLHGGSYAARFLISDVTADAYRGELNQEIACAAGKDVTAGIWGKTIITPTALARAALEVSFLNASGQVLSVYSSNMGGQADWRLLQISARSPANTVKLRFVAALAAPRYDNPSVGGKAYFDDGSLTIANPPPPQGCFLAGTPITMANGSIKPIENIKVGDMVLAFNEAAQKMQPDKVTQLFRHPKEGVYLIVNKELKVTPIHRVLSQGKWVEIGKLKVGDSLTNTKGEAVAIKSIAMVKEPVDIYNFEVNPLHTYVAGGYVVHNRKVYECMVEQGLDGPPDRP